MTLWGSVDEEKLQEQRAKDEKFFRSLGIAVTPRPAKVRLNWAFLIAGLGGAFCSGAVLYGVYLVGAWALQKLGVVLTGLPK